IDRDLVKPATMTTPYGVTRGTMYEELLETDAIKSCINPPECARYLAKVLEESIPEVAIEAGKIMVLLRNVARILAKANRPVAWTTPTGFYVVHGVREPKAVRVTTSDSTFTIYADDEKRKIDWRKQVDGIVAHFVHSMDAAHMMLTINRLYADGIRHFAMGPRQLRRPCLRHRSSPSRSSRGIRSDLFRTRPAEVSGRTEASPSRPGSARAAPGGRPRYPSGHRVTLFLCM